MSANITIMIIVNKVMNTKLWIITSLPVYSAPYFNTSQAIPKKIEYTIQKTLWVNFLLWMSSPVFIIATNN